MLTWIWWAQRTKSLYFICCKFDALLLKNSPKSFLTSEGSDRHVIVSINLLCNSCASKYSGVGSGVAEMLEIYSALYIFCLSGSSSRMTFGIYPGVFKSVWQRVTYSFSDRWAFLSLSSMFWRSSMPSFFSCVLILNLFIIIILIWIFKTANLNMQSFVYRFCLKMHWLYN